MSRRKHRPPVRVMPIGAVMSAHTLSLAQYVASIGGISMRDPALQGETDRLRELNTCLRGRNAIVRTDGRTYDVVARACIDEGYPIEEGAFFDALESDAVAWADGTDRGRVYADYDWNDDALSAFDAEYVSWLMERDAPSTLGACTVCGCSLPRDHDPHCDECDAWARALTGDESIATGTPDESIAQNATAAPVTALEIFLDNHNTL